METAGLAPTEVSTLPLLAADGILLVVAVMMALTAFLPSTVSATFLEQTWAENSFHMLRLFRSWAEIQ